VIFGDYPLVRRDEFDTVLGEILPIKALIGLFLKGVFTAFIIAYSQMLFIITSCRKPAALAG
jgi:hypothetical protein